jgi:hypothetical protein
MIYQIHGEKYWQCSLIEILMDWSEKKKNLLVFSVNKPINDFIIDRSWITDDSFFDVGILFISLSVKFIQKDWEYK